MGVKVGRGDRGWETSVCVVEMSDKGKQLFKRDRLVSIVVIVLHSLYIDYSQSIHQMHRDIVYDFPDGVTPLGSSPVCKNQGMYVKDRLITIQGHPEFNEAIMRELLEIRKDQGLWPIEEWQAGMDKVADHHDGVVVAAAFLRFLLDD